MRQGRLKVSTRQPYGYYHCYGRLQKTRPDFSAPDKELFLSHLKRASLLCQVRVLAFIVMDNHFHILVEVPSPPSHRPDAHALLEILSPLLSPSRWKHLKARWDHLSSQPHLAQQLQESLEPYHRRMWDVSSFIKTLKESFSQELNRLHDLKGSPWDDRFGSVIVQGSAQTLLMVASYVELNAVRAGIAPEGDPALYRWSSLAMAMGGEPRSLEGITRLMGCEASGQSLDPKESLERYREVVYRRGAQELESVDEEGRPMRGVIAAEKVREVIRNRGRVSVGEYVRCRVGYFVKGLVLGSREYVEEVLRDLGQKVSGRRQKRGAQRLEGVEEELYSLRSYSPDLFG